MSDFWLMRCLHVVVAVDAALQYGVCTVTGMQDKALWKNSDEVIAARKDGFQKYLDVMAKHSAGNLEVRELLRDFLTSQ